MQPVPGNAARWQPFEQRLIPTRRKQRSRWRMVRMYSQRAYNRNRREAGCGAYEVPKILASFKSRGRQPPQIAALPVCPREINSKSLGLTNELSLARRSICPQKRQQ